MWWSANSRWLLLLPPEPPALAGSGLAPPRELIPCQTQLGTTFPAREGDGSPKEAPGKPHIITALSLFSWAGVELEKCKMGNVL